MTGVCILRMLLPILLVFHLVRASWIKECLQLKDSTKSSWPDVALDPANEKYTEVALRNIDLPNSLLDDSELGLSRRILWRINQSRILQRKNIYQANLQTDSLTAELQLHLDKLAYRVLHSQFAQTTFMLNNYDDWWTKENSSFSLPPELEEYLVANDCVEDGFICGRFYFLPENHKFYAILASSAWNFFHKYSGNVGAYLTTGTACEDNLGLSIGTRLQRLDMCGNYISRQYFHAFLEYCASMLKLCPTMDRYRLEEEKLLLALSKLEQ